MPSQELMEAAGRRLAEAVAGLAPRGPGADRLWQGQQRRRRAGRGAPAGRDGLRGRDAAALARGGAERRCRGQPRALRGRACRRRPRPRLAGSGAVVDAVFGTGFAGEPREPAPAAIEAINRCGAPVVACDIASGVDASSGEVAGAAVEARPHRQLPRRQDRPPVAPGKWHTGELRVAPIGIPAGAPARRRRGRSTTAVLGLAPRRGARSTKFSSGQVTIAGGSRGLTGAVRMSSQAAIRAGAGYATVAVPADLEPVFEAGQPEVMSVGCPGGDGCLAPASAKPCCGAFERAAAGVLGPGLGRDPGSVELAREVVGAIEAPLVIDADGLNAFAGELGRIAAREAPTVLTPHAGELGRLLDRASEEIGARRLAAAREAAPGRRGGRRAQGRRHDRHRRRAGRGQRRSSAPALATAGTGDVLSGITAALLARGLEPFAAACAAVLAHARAGRDAAARIGAAESVIADRRDRLDPGGDACRLARSNNLARDEDRRRDHGRRRAQPSRRTPTRAPRSSCSPRPTRARSRSSTRNATWSGSSASRT